MVLRIPWTAGVRRLLPSLVLTYLRAQLLSLLMVRPELDGDVDVLPSERWPPERLRNLQRIRNALLFVVSDPIRSDLDCIAATTTRLTERVGVRWKTECVGAAGRMGKATYSDATYNIHQ